MVSVRGGKIIPDALRPSRELRLDTLSAIEARFEKLRTVAPDLQSAVVEAFACIGLPNDAAPVLRDAAAWRDTVAGIVAAMEAASRPSELAYHNRHHTAEVVLSMGWLCAEAIRQGSLSVADAQLGVVAMIGHDLGHDGSPPEGGRLERQAAGRVVAIAAQAGLAPELRDRVGAVILGTDPAMIAPNRARALGEMDAGPFGASTDLLRALANDADVLASLLPRLGSELSRKLAAEWRANGHPERAAQVLGFAGRVSFLQVYCRFTPPAIGLGLAALQAKQMAAFANAAGMSRPARPEDAAAKLDGLDPGLAWKRYMKALRQLC